MSRENPESVRHPSPHAAQPRLVDLGARLGSVGSVAMKAKGIVICVSIGVIVTPIAFFLALLSAGAGHGHYVFARLFFPYSMLLTRWANDTITFPLILLALVQFPLYGAIIGIATSKRPLARLIGCVAAVLIVVVHAIAVMKCFSGLIPNFSWDRCRPDTQQAASASRVSRPLYLTSAPSATAIDLGARFGSVAPSSCRRNRFLDSFAY